MAAGIVALAIGVSAKCLRDVAVAETECYARGGEPACRSYIGDIEGLAESQKLELFVAKEFVDSALGVITMKLEDHQVLHEGPEPALFCYDQGLRFRNAPREIRLELRGRYVEWVVYEETCFCLKY